jgi:DNA-binding transcriptional MerR regulator
MNPEELSGKRTYALADLCGMFGFTARQIHDFRAKGALPSPIGSGRGARYTDEHVLRLGAIKPLLESGLSVSRIASRYISPEQGGAGNSLADAESERWDRLRINPNMDLAFCVRGGLESHRADLARLLAVEAKRLLLALQTN